MTLATQAELPDRLRSSCRSRVALTTLLVYPSIVCGSADMGRSQSFEAGSEDHNINTEPLTVAAYYYEGLRSVNEILRRRVVAGTTGWFRYQIPSRNACFHRDGRGCRRLSYVVGARPLCRASTCAIASFQSGVLKKPALAFEGVNASLLNF